MTKSVMPRILMVVSSHSTLPGNGVTGVWLEELAASYYEFLDAGCELELASPKGGVAPLDPLSLNEPWLTAHGRRYQSDQTAMKQLADTQRLADIDPLRYDALYLVGGAATAWDFPEDPHLPDIVATLFSRGRPVAGVCHGVLGLTTARADGAPIVAGRNVTGISNAEEIMTGFDKLVPVLPETRLRHLGGHYSCAPPFEAHVAIDGHVFTGQNPASAGPLASAMLERLRR